MVECVQQLPDPTTPAELASALRTTPAFVWREIQRGHLKALLPTSRRADQRIALSAIASWLNGNRTSQPAADAHLAAREPVTVHEPWVLLGTPEVCAAVGVSRT